MFQHPLVHALVPPAEEEQAVLRGQLPDERTVEAAPLGAEEHTEGRRGSHGAHCLDRLEQRFRLHDHPGASPEGVVIDRAVPVVSPCAQVVDLHLNVPRLPGAAED